MVTVKLSHIYEGQPVWVRDATADDSSKAFTVPANTAWILQSVYAEITATATVGNRALLMTITDGTNTIYQSKATASIAASQIGSLYISNSGGASDTTVRRALSGVVNTNVSLNCYDLPKDMVLLPGSVVAVADLATIAPAADDLTIILHYIECPII